MTESRAAWSGGRLLDRIVDESVSRRDARVFAHLPL
jgi:hypothetical protein